MSQQEYLATVTIVRFAKDIKQSWLISGCDGSTFAFALCVSVLPIRGQRRLSHRQGNSSIRQ